MASPPQPRRSAAAAAAAGAGGGGGGGGAPVDALFLQNLMSRVQLRPPFLDTNSFLTQDLDDFLLNELDSLSAAAGGADSDDSGGLSDGEDGDESGEERRRRMLALEEAKLDKEIVRLVLSGAAEEALKPNSGQSVAVGDHHVCVGFHEEAGGEYRVWEWHGHIMLFDDEEGYSAEYIYGNHFEPLSDASKTKKKETKKKVEQEKDSDWILGLRDLLDGIGNGSKDNGSSGRVVHRNLVNAGSAASASGRQKK